MQPGLKASLGFLMILISVMIFGMTYAIRAKTAQDLASELTAARRNANTRSGDFNGGIFGKERAKIFLEERDTYVRVWIGCGVAAGAGVILIVLAITGKTTPSEDKMTQT